jgi:hypothetical protein
MEKTADQAGLAFRNNPSGGITIQVPLGAVETVPGKPMTEVL